jgi:tryptophan synthase alpha chain
MNRIEEMFRQLRQQKKKALIPYLTAGFPSLEDTSKLVLEFEKQGANLIELGVPFSDPLADGPVIQNASQEALKNKITLAKVIEQVENLRKITEIPIVLLTYYNPVYHYGVERFVRDASQNGVDGVIIPDLPPEEADVLKRSSLEYDFSTIFLLAPTSTDERIRLVAESSTGFIYFVSVTGVTGEREILPKLEDRIKKVRNYTEKPIGVGFGVSKPEHVREISQYADAVIVGSAIISEIFRNLKKPDMIERIGNFVLSLSKGLLSERRR